MGQKFYFLQPTVINNYVAVQLNGQQFCLQRSRGPVFKRPFKPCEEQAGVLKLRAGHQPRDPLNRDTTTTITIVITPKTNYNRYWNLYVTRAEIKSPNWK